MFDFEKDLKEWFKDKVYLSASDKYPFRASVSDERDVVTILISTEMPTFQLRPLEYPKISQGDNIYVQLNGDSNKEQRTVESVKIPNDKFFSTMTLELTNASLNTAKNMTTYNISTVHGDKIQIGESNQMLVNISINELVEKVAKSDDQQAKSMLKQLLENNTVASIVGASATALLSLF